MTDRKQSLQFECDHNPGEPAMTRGEYNRLINALLVEGYRPGAPVLAPQYDRPTVERIACATCGGRLRYEPWLQHQPDRTRYRALAVCPSCGAATEF